MKTIKRLCAVAMIIAASQVWPAAAEEKWTPLFNGKDLSGWVVMHDATFAVTNSNLKLVTGMGWLRSEREYSNFVLELEWNALDPGYDSGIFIRASAEGKPWPRDGWQVNLSRAALGGLVRVTKTVVPAENPPAPLNNWVKFRIRAEGKKISLDVDGERAWEYEAPEAVKGFIGIQAENKAFEFRNIRIQELGE